MNKDKLVAEIKRRTGINVYVFACGGIENMTIGELVAIREVCKTLP